MSTSTRGPEIPRPYDPRYGAGRDLMVPARPKRPTLQPRRDPTVTYGIPPAIRTGRGPLFNPPANVVFPEDVVAVHHPCHHEAGVSIPSMKIAAKHYLRYATSRHGSDQVRVSARLQGVTAGLPPAATKRPTAEPSMKSQILEMSQSGASEDSIVEVLGVTLRRVRGVLKSPPAPAEAKTA